MPKSKVRKQRNDYTPKNNRTPVRVKAGPSSSIYVTLMAAFIVLGLAWLIVFELAADRINFIAALGAWNFLIGFMLMVIGLLMAMRWR